MNVSSWQEQVAAAICSTKNALTDGIQEISAISFLTMASAN
jgi:hypothetical protein